MTVFVRMGDRLEGSTGFVWDCDGAGVGLRSYKESDMPYYKKLKFGVRVSGIKEENPTGTFVARIVDGILYPLRGKCPN